MTIETLNAKAPHLKLTLDQKNNGVGASLKFKEVICGEADPFFAVATLENGQIVAMWDAHIDVFQTQDELIAAGILNRHELGLLQFKVNR